MDYFKCLACGQVVEVRYNEWPTCPCHGDGMYSHQVGNDFDNATEDEFWEWKEDNDE